MSSGERVSAHLELIFCSSEDVQFPAENLTRSGGARDEALAVWESEKFCEFPQELVFRVNRGIPTHIEQVNLLSHPFKVATRVEIFTSSAVSDGIHDGKTEVKFERLGFVCFQGSENPYFTACELQEVQLPPPISKITLLRLVLHSCHQTRTNLFSQVGLASVVALGPHKDFSIILPMIPSPKKSPIKCTMSPRRQVNRLYDTKPPGPTQDCGIKSPCVPDIWIPDSQERKTPEQICTDIQIGKQLAQFTGDDKSVQPWVSMEKEANCLMDTLERKTKLHIGVRVVDAKGIFESFVDLERRRKRQEEVLSQQMSFSISSRSPSNGGNVPLAFRGPRAPDVLKRFQTGQWQEREALLWHLTESSASSTRIGGCQLVLTDAEALEVLITALDDSNAHVFVAGCAFLRTLLTSLSYFQDAIASKTDLAEIVGCLLERLASREAPIRNAAAFAIMKVAGSTRTRGTFVVHLLLKHVESKHFQPSDQQLLALLKLVTSLLLSFHCCASFDIAPRRILRFLLLSDADQHENALIREAAKQLILALCHDVDEEFVLKNYVKQLPPEQQRQYDIFLHRKCDASS